MTEKSLGAQEFTEGQDPNGQGPNYLFSKCLKLFRTDEGWSRNSQNPSIQQGGMNFLATALLLCLSHDLSERAVGETLIKAINKSPFAKSGKEKDPH